MPIYEYQCVSCEHRLEALQKISDEPLQECPACHRPALKKLVSAASFRLKGSGWYETDFKTGDKKQLADAGSGDGDKDAGETAASGAGDAGKSKPESKPGSETGKQKPEADSSARSPDRSSSAESKPKPVQPD